MYLISVYFDEQTNKTINRYIKKVASVTKNDFMISHKVPPHMTISAVEAKNAESLYPVLERVKNKISSGDIYIASIGQLLPYVFTTNPVLNKYLQEISLTIYEEILKINDTSVNKYYKPWSWQPHITIGKTLEKEQMIDAFKCMQETFTPMTARITEIGLAKVNPHEDLIRYKL